MSRIEKLYESMILEHNKNPRNFKKISPCSCQAQGVNSLCGDEYDVFLSLDKENVIRDIGFTGSGCAISKSSASLMTEMVLNQPSSYALKLADTFINMLLSNDYQKEPLGKLLVFENVKNFPIRVKCATLIWRALQQALSLNPIGQIVSTE